MSRPEAVLDVWSNKGLYSFPGTTQTLGGVTSGKPGPERAGRGLLGGGRGGISAVGWPGGGKINCSGWRGVGSRGCRAAIFSYIHDFFTVGVAVG